MWLRSCKIYLLVIRTSACTFGNHLTRLTTSATIATILFSQFNVWWNGSYSSEDQISRQLKELYSLKGSYVKPCKKSCYIPSHSRPMLMSMFAFVWNTTCYQDTSRKLIFTWLWDQFSEMTWCSFLNYISFLSNLLTRARKKNTNVLSETVYKVW